MSVGLDVGSKTIKIIELEEESSGFNLRGSGIVGYQGIQVENINDDRELAALGGIIKKLHKEAGISKKEATVVVERIFREMADALIKGDRVELRGFCSFHVKTYKGYTGRNPKTGRPTKVKPKKLPFFKCGNELKKRMNSK